MFSPVAMTLVSPVQAFIPHKAATWNGKSASECLYHSFAAVEASILFVCGKVNRVPFYWISSDLFIFNGAGKAIPCDSGGRASESQPQLLAA